MDHFPLTSVGGLLEVQQLRVKERVAKNLFALHEDTPWKHDRASMYMESMVATIEHAHSNAVQTEMNE